MIASTYRTLGCLFVFALLLFSNGVARAEQAKPNIIFILADDLGYGDLGCYGQKQIETPHIDRLCEQGMKFTQHYSGSTVCAPSRSCLMTGLHTGHTYMRGNGNVALRPDPQDITVARLLKNAGYKTAMVGKSSLSCNVPGPQHPHDKGFDFFSGVLGHAEAHHYFPPRIYKNGKTIDLPNNHKHEGDTYIHDIVIKDALQFIDDNKDGPFFLHYSSLIPHVSLYAPEKWVAKYRGKFPERKVKQGHYRGTDEPNATWAAMISRLDWEVGQIVAKLREHGLEKNTIVIFASDNGATEAGGHRESDFNSSGPLRGAKRDMYEGGIRTPMIVWWPDTVEPGSESDHVSAFWDFLPTACDLAGIETPEGLDGISYLPTVLQKGEQKQHTHLYWEFFERGGRRAVRFGDYKAVQYNVKKNPNGPVEIYDLSRDIGETHNLASKRPDLVAKARKLFKESRTPSPIAKFNFPQ